MMVVNGRGPFEGLYLLKRGPRIFPKRPNGKFIKVRRPKGKNKSLEITKWQK